MVKLDVNISGVCFHVVILYDPSSLEELLCVSSSSFLKVERIGFCLASLLGLLEGLISGYTQLLI